jgi:hypothetical protein
MLTVLFMCVVINVWLVFALLLTDAGGWCDACMYYGD